MNPALREVQVPVLGSVEARALEIQREIDQVAALCTCPDLLHSQSFPEDAKQRAREILETLDNGSVGGYNLSYVMETMPQRIARFIERRDGGVPSDPENIVVSGGVSQAILTMLSLVVNPEEPLRTGILVPVPTYPLFGAAVAGQGAALVRYLLDEERGWSVNVAVVREMICAARKYCHPKVLCVINPGNPTGQVMSRRNMEEIIRLAAREKLLLFADEVYQENVFAPEAAFYSFKKVLYEMGPEYRERLQLVSFNSASKGVSGECGLRSGYVEFVNVDPAVFRYLHILKPFAEPSVIGVLALEVLMDPPRPGDPSYHTFMQEKRQLLSDWLEKSRVAVETLNRAPGIHCHPIQAAPYAYTRIHIPDRAIRQAQGRGLVPDVFFCHLLLEESGIVLGDGSSFGQAEGTYHVRISLMQPLEELRSTLNDIIAFHRKFTREFS
ncbi:alanine aminotransferase 2-like [Gastrophryne carolinensis]